MQEEILGNLSLAMPFKYSTKCMIHEEKLISRTSLKLKSFDLWNTHPANQSRTFHW